jgi:single-strand selective monofunctional uracil DNA glycosylase
MSSKVEAMLEAAETLSAACGKISFSGNVHTVYNTFDYAMPGYAAYVRKFVNGSMKALFLGMNPGPWGMAQTGVPFGEIPAVRDWMGLSFEINKPVNEHPKRPVEGLACARSEVSGRRLWGLFAELYGSPEAFFSGSFVLNYCPLSFMLESGANLTPDKLSAREKKPLAETCDAHLRRVIDILEPEIAIGVGGYATKCLEGLKLEGLRVGTLLHPSPASPIANREWPARPKEQLRNLGLLA